MTFCVFTYFLSICIYVYDHCVCCYYSVMMYNYFTIIVIFNCAYTDFCGINRPGFLGDVFTNGKFCQKKSKVWLLEGCTLSRIQWIQHETHQKGQDIPKRIKVLDMFWKLPNARPWGPKKKLRWWLPSAEVWRRWALMDPPCRRKWIDWRQASQGLGCGETSNGQKVRSVHRHFEKIMGTSLALEVEVFRFFGVPLTKFSGALMVFHRGGSGLLVSSVVPPYPKWIGTVVTDDSPGYGFGV